MSFLGWLQLKDSSVDEGKIIGQEEGNKSGREKNSRSGNTSTRNLNTTTCK